MAKTHDVIIIGGGFYGLRIAIFLRDELGVKDILVIEKEDEMMTHASYVNQARIHNGYHYPRSLLTGLRSAANFPRFVSEYAGAVVDDFEKYYAISKVLSKVNAKQFKNFTRKIKVDLNDVDESINKLFNHKLVESVYKVKEYAFNSQALRELLMQEVDAKPGIRLCRGEEVIEVKGVGPIDVVTSKKAYRANKVFNCAYSQINLLHRRSFLPLLHFKHELAEMALIKLPKGLRKFSITVMDGPFFSIMPFPSRGLHTLSHVRYTPHASWLDTEQTSKDKWDTHQYLIKSRLKTNYTKMYADVIRYIPALKDMEYVESITEVKTVLQKSENDDSRPILFREDFGISGYACIMGAKLDNIYDVFDELERFYEK